MFGDDDGDAGLENAGFFAGDFAQGVAEEIFVIEIHARDDGDGGRENICGVEAAAEADFENGEVHTLLREVFEGHGGDAFEIGGMSAQFAAGQKLFDGVVNFGEDGGEGVVADFLAIDANALVYFFEMRRSIEAGAQPGVAEDRFQKRGGRTFAVGAGDVRAGIGAAGTPEALIENGDIFEIEFGRGGLRGCSQFPAERKQVSYGGGVIHFLRKFSSARGRAKCR